MNNRSSYLELVDVDRNEKESTPATDRTEPGTGRNVLVLLCAGGWMPSNISEGWRRLGWEVTEYFYGTHMGKAWDNEGIQRNQETNEAIFSKAKELKSAGKLDLIFALIYDDVLSAETARQLRTLGVPMVNYHVDMLGQWYRILKTAKYFDIIACAHNEHWKGLRRAGARPYLLPMAANPVSQESGEPRFTRFDGVLYLGSPWLYRRTVLAELVSARIPTRIYGRNWSDSHSEPSPPAHLRKDIHDLRFYLLPRLREEGKSGLIGLLRRRAASARMSHRTNLSVLEGTFKGAYSDDDFPSLVRSAAINIGFSNVPGRVTQGIEGKQMRLRDFEIPMAGGFYLAEDCPQLRQMFEPGVHLETWKSISELKDKIRFYLQNPELSAKIARQGFAHCKSHHTWSSRFHGLLAELGIPTAATQNAKAC